MSGILANAHKRVMQKMQPQMPAQMYNGGGTVYANNGADLRGHPGGPMGTDTVPAWLTEGEFVVDKDSAQMFAPALEKINNWEPSRDGSPEYIMSMIDDMINQGGGA